ncbi:MAG: fibronectin type III domain-containing protein [Clostridia bacterium]|nr:fibronectin type III domain-containing protein [Clostridia bacterium]
MKKQSLFSCRLLSLVLSLVMLFTMTAISLPVSADHSHDPVDLDATYGTLIETAVTGEGNYKMAFEVLDIVNAERKKAGLGTLAMDKTMLEYAMQRAAECAVYYSHIRPNGESCFTIIEKHMGAGENIAAGYLTAAEVMSGWMKSDGHKTNILMESYQSIGVGCFKIGDYYYWCQVFNGMKKQASPTQKKPIAETRTIEARTKLLDLNINETKLSLKDGETATLQVTNCNLGFPYEYGALNSSGLTFVPAKLGIVTVSKSGVVTPIGNGTTTIAVNAKNGVKLFTVSVTAQVKTPHTTHDYTAATCTKAKTCKICGITSGKAIGHKYTNDCDASCNVCKATRNVGHIYEKKVTKATLTKDGVIKNVCKKCGYVASKTTAIYKASKISLSTTSYTYTGSVRKPSVVVKDSKGKTISSSNYTVTYASGRKNIGKYKVTVKMKGNYSGTKTLYFQINPAKTTLGTLTASTKALTVKWSKKTTQVTGYQIQYSTSKSFKSYTTKTISKNSITGIKLTGLKAKTTYYVRIRTYKTVGSVKYYSGWSTIKYKKTK